MHLTIIRIGYHFCDDQPIVIIHGLFQVSGDLQGGLRGTYEPHSFKLSIIDIIVFH